MSVPPRSGVMKPMPLSSCQTLTTPVFARGVLARIAGGAAERNARSDPSVCLAGSRTSPNCSQCAIHETHTHHGSGSCWRGFQEP
eukprot:6336505-Prorocentrum_lima.AAC.1